MEMSALCVLPHAKLVPVRITAHHAIRPITYLMGLVPFYVLMALIVTQPLKLVWPVTILAPSARQHHIASLALILYYIHKMETVFHCAVVISYPLIVYVLPV